MITTVDISKWDKRNVWPTNANELAVRPGLTSLFSTFVDELLSYTFISGFTVKNPRTDFVTHYSVANKPSSNELYLVLTDENWHIFQTIRLPIIFVAGNLFDHLGLSFSLVEDEILVTSPHFASYWGVVGGPLILAEKVASVNVNFTANVVPRGVSIGWAGRAVVAAPDGTLWFSDALAPRTFVGQNAINPPGGSIYGLHVNAGGALVVCTATGVYALPEDAAAVGQIVVGVFSKLSDYTCIQYDTSSVCKGRVYGLTQRGYALIDTQTMEEVELDEKLGNRATDGRISFANYKLGRIYGTNDGVVVTIGGFSNFSHLSSGFKSWWLFGTRALNIVGVLFNDDGEEFYLTSAAPLYKNGPFDESVSASIFGRFDMPSSAMPVIRGVHFKTNGSTTRSVHINGVTVSDTITAVSPIIGTDSWGAGVYREDEILTCQTQWSIRTNNVGAEFKITGSGAILPSTVDIIFKGPGKVRVL